MKQLVRNVKIVGTGSYVPGKSFTNDYLETILDTNTDWIEKNLGIGERRIAVNNEASSDLAWKAGEKAIENASRNITKNNINLGYGVLGMIKDVPEYFIGKLVEEIPMKRLCNREEILSTVNYLIDTGHITGTSIIINGGLI